MDPVVDPFVARRSLRLSDLIRMMHGNVVHPAGVNVEVLTEILGAHGAALDMPAGVPAPPRRVPDHGLVFELRLRKPQDEVPRVPLVLVNLDARTGPLFLTIEQRELAVVRELAGIEVDVTTRLVGIPVGLDALDHLDHIVDVIRSLADHRGLFDIEFLHVVEEGLGEVLGDVPDRLSHFAGALDDLVFALVGIVGKMTDIRYVHHVADLVPEVLESAAKLVLEDVAAQISDMGILIDRGPAGIHTHSVVVDGYELLYRAAERVKQAK